MSPTPNHPSEHLPCHGINEHLLPPSEERKKSSSAVIWATYLMMAMPYNFAMASEWRPVPVYQGSYQLASVATPAAAPRDYYQITAQDASDAIVAQLQSQGIEEHVEATLNPTGNGGLLASANHPLRLVIHGLQIDPDAKRWQAQAYILHGTQTQKVLPISGRYEPLSAVPVLRQTLRASDIIAAEDIETRYLPSRRLRKDTLIDPAQLIGQSARGMISAERPIRASEISAPVLIKKGDVVEMRYQTPHMQIRTTGIALENGLAGNSMRVKNEKSEKAVTARVVAVGQVEVSGMN